MIKGTLRLIILFGALGLALLVIVGGGWYVFRRGEGGSQAWKEIRASSLEEALLGIYLRLRREDVDAPASDDPTPIIFTVQPGETAATIATRLQRQGLIRDAELFRLLLRYRKVDEKLEAGDYQLRPDMTMDEIIARLQHGRFEAALVIIPEGWRAGEIAALLEERGIVDSQEFMELVQGGSYDYDFLRDRPQGSSLEGYLFPDTYRVPPRFNAADFIDLMLKTFDARFTSQMRQAAAAKGWTIHEVVTLASIVEREAIVALERPIIASVFINRWEAGMKLDADPTVQYALGYQEEGKWWKTPLLLEDLQVDSPYNTYLNAGLPPGPICNPGLASIQAVLEPAETDYLYFVAVGDGSHAFAKTLEEHNKNREKYQR